MENFGFSRESDMLKLHWFHADLTKVNVDNGICTCIYLHLNACHDNYDVFIKFKLRVFFFLTQ